MITKRGIRFFLLAAITLVYGKNEVDESTEELLKVGKQLLIGGAVFSLIIITCLAYVLGRNEYKNYQIR